MNIKKQVKELWKLCFDDTDEFIGMYFRRRYSDENTPVILQGDKVIASLQMIPYEMTFLGTRIQTAYISGACTHPDFRKQGIMRKLLINSFGRMLEKQMYVSTLIPATPELFDYYAHAGYVPLFDYSIRKLWISPITFPEGMEFRLYDEENEHTIYEYFNRKMSERNCCIQHDADDFKTILEDLTISDGRAFYAQKDGCIEGIIFVEPAGAELIVKELLANNEAVANALLHYAGQIFNAEFIAQSVPADNELQTFHLGMMRITDAMAMLQLYAASNPTEALKIELTDNQIPANNGYYSISEGKCAFSKNKLSGPYTHLTIGELTGKIFQNEKPYMSLMLN